MLRACYFFINTWFNDAFRYHDGHIVGHKMDIWIDYLSLSVREFLLKLELLLFCGLVNLNFKNVFVGFFM